MTEATTTKPIVHIFKEVKIGKYPSTRHYELDDVINGKAEITDRIKISNNREFNKVLISKAKTLFYQRTKDGKKWDRYQTSALFNTSNNLFCFGDVAPKFVKTHSLIYKYSTDMHTLNIYYFKDYYNANYQQLISLIDKNK